MPDHSHLIETGPSGASGPVSGASGASGPVSGASGPAIRATGPSNGSLVLPPGASVAEHEGDGVPSDEVVVQPKHDIPTPGPGGKTWIST